MKKSEAKALLESGNAQKLLKRKVGSVEIDQWKLVVGRLEAKTPANATPQSMEEDNGWTVIAIKNGSISLDHASTVTSNYSRIVTDTYVLDVGFSVLAGADTPGAGIWHWLAD